MVATSTHSRVLALTCARVLAPMLAKVPTTTRTRTPAAMCARKLVAENIEHEEEVKNEGEELQETFLQWIKTVIMYIIKQQRVGNINVREKV